MKEKLIALIKDEDRESSVDKRRLCFALSVLPTVFNLFMYALFIKEIRVLLLVLAGIAAVFFALVFFFEIKDGEWSVLSLAASALISLLTSLFFPLAYKIYIWLTVIAIELAGMILIYIYKNKIKSKFSR